MGFIVTISIGVLSSICASVIFVFFLTRLRPKIKISDFVVIETMPDSSKKYWLKFVNYGRRDIIDARFELLLSTPRNAADGISTHRKTIMLIKDSMMFIPAYDKHDPFKSYAKRISTSEPLDTLWNDEHTYLTLRIIGKDAVSGFSKFFVKDMYSKNSTLREKKHKTGLSLDVE